MAGQECDGCGERGSAAAWAVDLVHPRITLGKSLHLSKAQCLHVWNVDSNSICFMGISEDQASSEKSPGIQ